MDMPKIVLELLWTLFDLPANSWAHGQKFEITIEHFLSFFRAKIVNFWGFQATPIPRSAQIVPKVARLDSQTPFYPWKKKLSPKTSPIII